MTKIIKRTLKRSGAVLAILFIVILIGLSAILFTEKGRLWLSDRAIAALEGTGTTIDLEQLKSPSLGEWSVSALTIKNGETVLAQAQQVKLSWRPNALLKMQLWISELSAEKIQVFDLPEPEVQPEEVDKTPFQLSLPNSPISLRLGKLNIKRLDLPTDLATNIPKSWRASASGNVFVKSKPPSLSASLQTIDAPQQLSMRIDSSIKSNKLVTLSGKVEEEKGGWLQRLAQIPPQTLKLTFSLSAEQNSELWNVDLSELNTELLGSPISAKANITVNTKLPAVELNMLDLWVDEQLQQASARYTSDQLQFNLKLNELGLSIVENWAPMIEGGKLSGELDGSWNPSTPEQWPSLQGRLNGATRLYEEEAFIHSQFVIEKQLIRLGETQLRFGENTVSAKGVVDIYGDQNKLAINIKKIDTSLMDTFGIDKPEVIKTLQASIVNTHLNVRGSFKQPEGNVNGQIDGHFQKQHFAVTVSADATDKYANIEQFKLKADDGSIQASGRLDWNSATNDLRLTFIDLREPLLKLVPSETPLPEITFDLNGKARIQGALLKPKLTTDLTINGELPANGERIPFKAHSNGEVFVGTLNETRINLSDLTVALFGRKIIEAKGVYTQDNLDFKLDVTRLPHRALEIFGITNVKGDAEAKLRLSGTFQDPQLDGYVTYLEQSSADSKSRIKSQELKLKFKTLESILYVDTNYSLNKKPSGALQISLPLAKYLTYTNESNSSAQERDNFPLEATLKGHLELSASEALLNPELHNLRGSLKLDLQVEGTFGQPNLVGEASLEKGRYTNEVSEVTWENIQAKLVGKGEVLELKTLRLENGDSGYISMSGKVNWAASQRNQPNAILLNLQAKNARLIDRRNLLAEVGGKLDLTGSFKELTLEGLLELAPLHASIDSAISSSIPSIEVHEVSEHEDTSSQMLPIVNLDLRIVAEQQAYIRGRGLEAELEGEVNVQGTASEPMVDGRFGTRRGKMDLFGKRFTLEQGEVLFSNDSATLRIPAFHEGEEVTTKLEIYGSAKAPKIKLESIPPLPEDEILSRLIFGKSVNNISPFQAVRLAQAVRTLSSEGGFDPLDATRHMLGVDSINIENQDDDEGSGVRVGVGKYINDKVYLQLEKTPNPSQPWQATIEVELTPRIHLESGTNDNGGAGAELIWKKNY